MDRNDFLAIDSFVGPFAFLSNSFCSPVYWNGHLYPCASCAIYAAQYDVSEEEVRALQQQWKKEKMPDDVKELLEKTDDSHRVWLIAG